MLRTMQIDSLASTGATGPMQLKHGRPRHPSSGILSCAWDPTCDTPATDSQREITPEDALLRTHRPAVEEVGIFHKAGALALFDASITCQDILLSTDGCIPAEVLQAACVSAVQHTTSILEYAGNALWGWARVLIPDSCNEQVEAQCNSDATDTSAAAPASVQAVDAAGAQQPMPLQAPPQQQCQQSAERAADEQALITGVTADGREHDFAQSATLLGAAALGPADNAGGRRVDDCMSHDGGSAAKPDEEEPCAKQLSSMPVLPKRNTAALLLPKLVAQVATLVGAQAMAQALSASRSGSNSAAHGLSSSENGSSAMVTASCIDIGVDDEVVCHSTADHGASSEGSLAAELSSDSGDSCSTCSEDSNHGEDVSSLGGSYTSMACDKVEARDKVSMPESLECKAAFLLPSTFESLADNTPVTSPLRPGSSSLSMHAAPENETPRIEAVYDSPSSTGSSSPPPTFPLASMLALQPLLPDTHVVPPSQVPAGAPLSIINALARDSPHVMHIAARLDLLKRQRNAARSAGLEPEHMKVMLQRRVNGSDNHAGDIGGNDDVLAISQRLQDNWGWVNRTFNKKDTQAFKKAASQESQQAQQQLQQLRKEQQKLLSDRVMAVKQLSHGNAVHDAQLLALISDILSAPFPGSSPDPCPCDTLPDLHMHDAPQSITPTQGMPGYAIVAGGLIVSCQQDVKTVDNIAEDNAHLLEMMCTNIRQVNKLRQRTAEHVFSCDNYQLDAEELREHNRQLQAQVRDLEELLSQQLRQPGQAVTAVM